MNGRMDAVYSESHFILAGEAVTIRPMRITDIDIETEFIRRLSPESKHYRFMGGVKELSRDEVSRLCTVDGRLSMAFVATTRSNKDRETEIGVSRCAPDTEPDAREFAVTVADEWQRRGLGTLLMNQLIRSARGNGVKRLYSVALWDNDGMRALAKRLGMSASQDPANPQQTVYSLGL
ncbi:MAG: GNAT family N-acetyltransferase [Steroidobacterales bacterium]